MRKPIFNYNPKDISHIQSTSNQTLDYLSSERTNRDLCYQEFNSSPQVIPPEFIKPTIFNPISISKDNRTDFSEEEVKSNSDFSQQGSFFFEATGQKEQKNYTNHNQSLNNQSLNIFKTQSQSQTLVDQIHPQNTNISIHKDSDEASQQQIFKQSSGNDIQLKVPQRKKSSFPSTLSVKRAIKALDQNRRSNQQIQELKLKMTQLQSELKLSNVLGKTEVAEMSQSAKFIQKVLIIINFINRMKAIGGFFRQNTLNSNQFKLLNDASHMGITYHGQFQKQVGSCTSFDSKKSINPCKNQQSVWKTSSFRSQNQLSIRKHGDSIVSRVINIYQITKKSSLVQKISELPTFSPHSRILDFFEIIQFIMSLLCIIYLPIEVAAKQTFYFLYGNKWDWFIIGSITLFILNLFVNFNRGFYDKGLIVMNRGAIAKYYIKQGFLYDFVSIAPLILSYLRVTGDIQFLNILIFLRIKNLMESFWKCSSKFESNNWTRLIVVLKLIRIILTILFQAHLFACVFLGLVIHQNNHENWIVKYNNKHLLDSNWFNKYVYAFYWAITTMTTVGLGDISPNNLNEIVCYTIFMMSATCMFAYYFNAIGIVVQEMNKRNKQFSGEMTKTLRFLQSKQIEPELQQEVRKYLQYKYNAEKNMISLEEEREILNKLNPEIQQKVLYSANMKIIECSKFLKDNFSNQFISKLAVSVKSQHYLNDQYIYREGSSKENSLIEKKLYFIQEGTVQILNENQKTGKEHFIEVLKRGDVFGQYEFFSNKNYIMSAKSVEPVQLLSIQLNEFVNLTKDFPNDYEQFCMIRDKFQILLNIQQLEIKCQSCGKIGHNVLECDKIHYIPNRELLLLKVNFFKIPSTFIKLYFLSKDQNQFYTTILKYWLKSDKLRICQIQNFNLIHTQFQFISEQSIKISIFLMTVFILKSNFSKPITERSENTNTFERYIQVNALSQNQIVKESIREYQEATGILQLRDETPMRYQRNSFNFEFKNCSPQNSKNNNEITPKILRNANISPRNKMQSLSVIRDIDIMPNQIQTSQQYFKSNDYRKNNHSEVGFKHLHLNTNIYNNTANNITNKKLIFNNISQIAEEGENSKNTTTQNDGVDYSHVLLNGLLIESRRSNTISSFETRIHEYQTGFYNKSPRIHRISNDNKSPQNSPTYNKTPRNKKLSIIKYGNTHFGDHIHELRQRQHTRKSLKLIQIPLSGEQNLKRSQGHDEDQQHHHHRLTMSTTQPDNNNGFSSLSQAKDELDVMREYSIYFPNHNYFVEINKYNNSLKKQITPLRNNTYHLFLRNQNITNNKLTNPITNSPNPFN